MLRRAILVLALAATLIPVLPALADTPMGPTFAAPRTLPLSSGFGEPSIATAPDGTLYVTAPTSASALWRSLDGGTSWRRVADSLGSSGDSDVAVDANGVVYVSDLFSNVPVSTSYDQGATFAHESASATPGSNDRQWLAASGDGNVFSVWRDGSTERIAVSHDRGVSWTRHVVATGVGLQGNIVATSDAELWIPYSGNGGIWVAHSIDAGQTWTQHRAGSGTSSTLFPALAVDAAGIVYVAWSAKSNDDLGYEIRIARSANGGASFASPTLISTPGTVAIFPWIVAGDQGRVAVVWYEGRSPTGVPLAPDVSAATPWVVRVAFSDDADSGAAAGWVADDATGVFHTGPICTMGTLCFPVANPVAMNRMLLDFFEATMTLEGDLIIAYTADSSVVNTGGTVLKLVRQTGGPNLRE